MTYEEYYEKNYEDLKKAQIFLTSLAEQYKTGDTSGKDLQPVIYYSSRIKSPESMLRKLEARGFPQTLHSALNNVYDAVGLRIICSFASDVFAIVKKLEGEPGIEIIQKKDYLSHPKPNGYRSIHLCIRLKETGVLAEIQIRTIAMDFWATLEHQLKYKKDIADEALIKSELKRCADEIASVDISMQTIREIIKEQ